MAIALDPHVPRALEGVDTDERVTRMDEDLLVLLEPVIDRVPWNRDVPVEVGISKAARRGGSGAPGDERHVLAGGTRRSAPSCPAPRRAARVGCRRSCPCPAYRGSSGRSGNTSDHRRGDWGVARPWLLPLLV